MRLYLFFQDNGRMDLLDILPLIPKKKNIFRDQSFGGRRYNAPTGLLLPVSRNHHSFLSVFCIYISRQKIEKKQMRLSNKFFLHSQNIISISKGIVIQKIVD